MQYGTAYLQQKKNVNIHFMKLPSYFPLVQACTIQQVAGAICKQDKQFRAAILFTVTRGRGI
jgi:hypothetical protein